MDKYILGISAFYHDSAASLLKNGEILCAAQEERFTRVKQDSSFPAHSVQFCMNFAGIGIEDIDLVVFYDKPLLKFERLLETYYGFAPRGLKSFIAAIPVWIKEKMFLKNIIKNELFYLYQNQENADDKIKKHQFKYELIFPEHHLSHCASAFYPSPYEESAILTIDGVGEWATASIAHGTGNKIKMLKELRFPHSLGLLYSAFTHYCGFKVNSGEYKLMGLAPYGIESEADRYVELIYEKMMKVKPDGSIWLNMDYFNYATGLTMTNDKKWEDLLSLPPREKESELEQVYCNLALAIQKITENVVLKMASHAKSLCGNTENLVLAGGVALNCCANGILQRSGIFKNIWIQPAAGDAGGALGAALIGWYIYHDEERIIPEGVHDMMKGSYLGPEYTERDILNMIAKYGANGSKNLNDEELFKVLAKEIQAGKVIGWFSGRMEWGPRALGHRTIIGDARNVEMQKKLNLKIKYRESFRPFAPSVLMESLDEFFQVGPEGEAPVASPYMLLVGPVKPERCNKPPENYFDLPLKERLYFVRSDIPAVTHIDFTARCQTVHKETNPRYWNLINEFKKQTGFGLIVNTSFNVRGEPIVNSPVDAYKCFMRTEMDILVVENYIFYKDKQPQWAEGKSWKEEYVLD